MSSMYSLTAMTGREASANRTVVIGTIEFNWRVWIIMICAAPIALVATGVLWPFVGQVAIAAIPVVEIAAIWLVHRRTSQGLRLRTYQAFWDKKKATVDQFFLCGQPIEVNRSDYRQVTPNTVAYASSPPANTAQAVAASTPAEPVAAPRRARAAGSPAAAPAPSPAALRPASTRQAAAFPVGPASGPSQSTPAPVAAQPATPGGLGYVDVADIFDTPASQRPARRRSKDLS